VSAAIRIFGAVDAITILRYFLHAKDHRPSDRRTHTKRHSYAMEFDEMEPNALTLLLRHTDREKEEIAILS
jgi:hypothetical protein